MEKMTQQASDQSQSGIEKRRGTLYLSHLSNELISSPALCLFRVLYTETPVTSLYIINSLSFIKAPFKSLVSLIRFIDWVRGISEEAACSTEMPDNPQELSTLRTSSQPTIRLIYWFSEAFSHRVGVKLFSWEGWTWTDDEYLSYAPHFASPQR